MTSLTSSAKQNFAACVAMIIVAALSIALRGIVKLSQRQPLSISDWLCLLSFLLFCAYCGLIFNYIFNVSKYRAFDASLSLGLEEFVNILKTSFELELIMGCVITSAKLSILGFYNNIFSINKTAKAIIRGTAVACVVWFLIVTFILIFQCSPIDAYWNQFAQPPYCLVTQRILLGYELSNFFLDVIILCIPIGPVLRLQLSSAKKIAALGIILLGSFVCVASILRLTAIWDAKDPSREVNFPPAMMWSTIQLGLAIVCSCLQTLGPLLRSVGRPFTYLNDRYFSNFSRSKQGSMPMENGNELDGLQAKSGWVNFGSRSHESPPASSFEGHRDY